MSENKSLGLLIGASAGLALAYALRNLPARIFPFPDTSQNLAVPGAPSGSLGGFERSLFAADRCDPELVRVTTRGSLSIAICTTPEQAQDFMRRTNTARTLQVASFLAIIAGTTALGYTASATLDSRKRGRGRRST